jgi:hypothetical protein
MRAICAGCNSPGWDAEIPRLQFWECWKFLFNNVHRPYRKIGIRTSLSLVRQLAVVLGITRLATYGVIFAVLYINSSADISGRPLGSLTLSEIIGTACFVGLGFPSLRSDFTTDLNAFSAPLAVSSAPPFLESEPVCKSEIGALANLIREGSGSLKYWQIIKGKSERGSLN